MEFFMGRRILIIVFFGLVYNANNIYAGAMHEQTGYTTASLKHEWENRMMEDIEGIYEFQGNVSGSIKWVIGIKKTWTGYTGIYLSGADWDWVEGDLKAVLHPTDEANGFRTTWVKYNGDKSENFFIRFSGSLMLVEYSGTIDTYRKVFPVGLDHQLIAKSVERTFQTLIGNIASDSTIAILNIIASSHSDSEFITDELEYRLVNAGGFRIVDRRRLDQVRSEQDFQQSGDVEDEAAVSIGKMVGATIIISGNISGTGTSVYLNIKAIDVKTGQIVAFIRERI